ncbi:MAG: F0F1 ATP synthase subunit A [Elusimicrobiota bacterium]|jgi:F-type H+-transporting ATPase subunit a|nr:F0F1 ATP synthase subunit A [Elusimicrobiota bacterium]
MIVELLEHHIVSNYAVFGFNLFGKLINVGVYEFFLTLICALLILLLPLAARRKGGRIKTALELFVSFVRDNIVIPNLGERAGQRFLPFFCTLMLFLLFANYLGLVPQTHTVTANISITLGMALVSGSFIIALSLKENGAAGFLKTFVPSGVPVYLAPVIFPLEVISLFIRVFVLAIRLFANMAAGHMVLLGLFGFIFLLGAKSAVLGYGSSAGVLGMTLFVTILELLVAAIQAYVFTLLTAIFAGLQMRAH